MKLIRTPPLVLAVSALASFPACPSLAAQNSEDGLGMRLGSGSVHIRVIVYNVQCSLWWYGYGTDLATGEVPVVWARVHSMESAMNQDIA